MGGKRRDKVHEVSRSQIMKTFLYQWNYLNHVLKVVKDLTYGSTINRIIPLNDNSWICYGK